MGIAGVESSYVLPSDVGPVENRPSDGVSFGEAFRATFAYNYRPLLDAAAEQVEFGARTYDPMFDPFTQERIAGYEDQLNELALAKDEEHFRAITANIDRRRTEKETLAEAGIWSGGMWVAALIDPMNIAFAIPVWGQLGLMAKGGMTVRQAAAASARGGFVTGLVSESIRAPFDRTNTATETGMNLATMTAVSTILGSVPAMARGSYNSVRKGAAMRDEIFQGKGTLPESFGGRTISYASNETAPPSVSPARQSQLKTLDDEIARIQKLLDEPEALAAALAEAPIEGARNIPLDQLRKQLGQELDTLKKQRVTQNKQAQKEAGGGDTPGVSIKGKKVTIDEKALSEEFDKRPWVKPEVEGARPFKESDFLTPQEWSDFQIIRATVRDEIKMPKGRPTKSTKVAYINNTNKIAYDRMAQGSDLVETPFTSSLAFRMLTTPGKRIMRDGTPLMKRAYHLLAGVDQFRTLNVETGRTQHQSVARRAKTHVARSITTINEMKQLWSKDQLGRGLSTEVLGYNTDDLVARSQQKQTFDTWFGGIVDAKLMHSAGRLDLTDLSPENQQAVKVLDRFFKDYQMDLQDLNMLYDGAWFKQRVVDMNEKIAAIRDENASKGVAPTEKQAAALESMQKQVEFFEELIEARFAERYQFPIYYDKGKILSSESERQRLEQIFADWIRNHPIKKMYNAETQRFEAVRSTKTPEEIAKDAVSAILEEGEPITIMDVAAGAPKGKHLRHRMIDIPEHLISDFIIKDPRVLHSYAQRVGKRMEFIRNFGNRSIEEILDEFEVDMRAAGYSEKKIQGLRQDFLFDYERTMGEYVKSPDRFDAQFGKALKEIAGMSYLDAASIASVTDVGNIIMERGPGNLFLAHRSELDKALMQKAKNVVRLSGEANELALGGFQQRFIADNIEGINPNLQARIFNPITRAYYNIPVLGNGLGTLTYWFKMIDGVHRSGHYMDVLIKMANNTASKADVQYMARMGLNEDDARIIASYPHEKGDRYIFANVDAWPKSTKAEREILLKWNTAMNAGIGNTILHATSYDKPRVMDGVVYVRHRPWMNKIGLEVDTRASSASIKVARLESQAMTMPFQFFNFMLGATNRITAGMFDPMKRHRLVGGVSLIGLGYSVLHLKQLGNPWWFEKRSNTEILQRSIDQSGLFGVYGELAYIATHVAIGTGVMTADEALLKPKYNPSIGDVITEPLGAAPGMLFAWYQAAEQFFNGEETEAAEQFGYNSPTSPLISFLLDWFE